MGRSTRGLVGWAMVAGLLIAACGGGGGGTSGATTAPKG